MDTSSPFSYLYLLSLFLVSFNKTNSEARNHKYAKNSINYKR